PQFVIADDAGSRLYRRHGDNDQAYDRDERRPAESGQDETQANDGRYRGFYDTREVRRRSEITPHAGLAGGQTLMRIPQCTLLRCSSRQVGVSGAGTWSHISAACSAVIEVAARRSFSAPGTPSSRPSTR